MYVCVSEQWLGRGLEALWQIMQLPAGHILAFFPFHLNISELL